MGGMLSSRNSILGQVIDMSRLYLETSSRVLDDRHSEDRQASTQATLERRLCSCHPRQRKIVRRPLPFLALVTEHMVHSPKCRVHILAMQSPSRSVRIKFPRWFLDRTMELGYYSRAAYGGHFLSHFSMRVQPNITWYQSPTFVAVQQFWTRKVCYRWSYTETKAKFDLLLQRLDDLFIARKASPLDLDETEGSLLHVRFERLNTCLR